jgi:hypothetical protein
MTADPRLEALPRFQIREIGPRTDTALVTGTFSRLEAVAVQPLHGVGGEMSGHRLEPDDARAISSVLERQPISQGGDQSEAEVRSEYDG